MGALLMGLASTANAAWPPLGRSLCEGCTGSYFHRLATDGAGGVYVLWTDYRNYAANEEDVYLQRVLATGDIAPGWPVDGLPLCDTTRIQRGLDLIGDDSGGAIALWYDERSVTTTEFGTAIDLYAQRVRRDATLAPGWQRLGSPVARAPHIQLSSMTPGLAPDGAGGALFIYEDWQNYGAAGQWDIYMQHLTGAGMPASGWPADGRLVSGAPDFQQLPMIASDGSGGAIAAWEDYRNLPGDYDLGLRGQAFVARVLSAGTDALGWTPGGQPLITSRSRPKGLVPDGAGGAFVIHIPADRWQEESVIMAQRLTAAGLPAPGWPTEGVVLCDAPGTRNIGPSCGDGLGGLFVTWASNFDGEVYLDRVRPDGTRPPSWPEDGLRVSGLEPTPYGEYDSAIAPDGLGGCYVAWEHPTDCCNSVLVQHITASGGIAPGWPASGLKLPTTHTSGGDLVMIADGLGGAILAFSSPSGSPYVQRFGQDGIVAATVSFVRAEAGSDQIALRWYVGGEPAFQAMLERRTELDDEWRSLAEVSADGTGSIAYTDRQVAAGTRYAYRLRWSEHDATRTTSDVWVETPSLLRFALHGLQPNPSRGAAYAAFTLPSWAGGELELLDVTGRRVASREIGSLGPGRHVVRLDERETVPPGLYLVRLRWSDREATARGVVMR